MPKHTAIVCFAGIAMLTARLAQGAPPANDNFANRVTISSESGSTAGNNVDATGEPGEAPLLGIADATNTVWWQWTAPRDGYYTFATFGSSFNTVLGVYDGDSMAHMAQIAGNNDPEMYGLMMTLSAAVLVPARAGQTLQICVAGNGVLNEGSIVLSWYRETPHWIDKENVITSRYRRVYCIASGDALSWFEQRYARTIVGTNRSGMVIRRLYDDLSVENLRLDDRKNRLQFQLPTIGDVTRPHTVLQFDGKYVVIGEWCGQWVLDEYWELHAYKIKGGTLERQNSQTVTNRPLGVMRLGSDLLVWCMDFARVPYGRHTGMQRKLKRRRWSIPYGNAVLRGGFPNGMLVVTVDTFPTMDVEFWKRGRMQQSHRLPALVSGYAYQAFPDRRGGVLYCATRSGTNGPMTYVDRKGKTWFTDFRPTGFETFAFGRLTPRLLVLIGSDYVTGRFQTYKFGRTPALLGECLVPYGVSARSSGSEIHVYIQGGGTAGIRAYDKKLRRVKWENVGTGFYVYSLGRTTYCRVSSNTTSQTYTIFRKTKTIAAHTYAP
jgi:hypothetical protein